MLSKMWRGFAILMLALVVGASISDINGSFDQRRVFGDGEENQILPRINARSVFSRLPVYFEANEGQIHPSVRFLSRGRNYTLYLTSNQAILSLNPSRQKPSLDHQAEDFSNSHSVHIRFAGADLPTTSGAFDETYNLGFDAFVVKVDTSSGMISYANYLGGSGIDRALGIVLHYSIVPSVQL